MDKRRYFIRKIANALLTIVIIASLNFVLFHMMPGANNARVLMPKGKQNPAAIAKYEKDHHMDKPMWQQFVIYYWLDLLKGNLGNSTKSGKPVTQEIKEATPPTIVLAGLGTILATSIGLTAGVFAGWRRGSKFDLSATNAAMVTYAMPSFWVGLMVLMVFSAKLGWFPSGGMSDPSVELSGLPAVRSFLNHLALPLFVFTITYVAEYLLIMRSSLTQVMNEDFVLTGRAKGLADSDVLWKHTVPNALLPTVTLVMMNFGFIISGTVLDEVVFNWPGLGLLSYSAMNSYDFPVLQGVFLLMAVAVVVFNLLADIMLFYIDPRVTA